jgi:5-methyltetrahydropteroyltriglutamate--homocysteine methyltransferase
MKHSTDRILVSHAGNLPRPPEMEKVLSAANFTGTPEYARMIPDGVKWIVDQQIACGVDVVNDGEYVKAGSFGGYIQSRVSGWETRPRDPNRPAKHAGVGARDAEDFPGTFVSGLWLAGSGGPIRPGFPNGRGNQTNAGTERVCTGPVNYTGQAAIAADVANLKAALQGKPVEGYIAALGALSTGASSWNEYYPSEEAYMMAVAEALREEYKAITDAGLIVQIDEPQFCTTWQFHPEWTVPELRKYLEAAVEVLNHSLEGIPQDQVRFHTCWGSGHRPHTQDSNLRDFADIMVKINAQEFSVEAANVRHEWEWQVWKDVKLPDGKILMPGVISHATDLVEHPETVAERLVKYANVVGRANVKTGTDCGIGSRVGHEEIVWAKLKSMAEGARLASDRLWK